MTVYILQYHLNIVFVAESIKDLYDHMLEKYKDHGTFKEYSLLEVWSNINGINFLHMGREEFVVDERGYFTITKAIVH